MISKICGLAFFFPLVTFAQQKIHGEIKNESGEPVIGAKVFLEGTYLGTYSEADGSYEIDNVKKGTYALKVTSFDHLDFQKSIEVADADLLLNIELTTNVMLLQPYVVMGVRANEKTPFTYTNLDAKDISSANFGQDLPYLLSTTPSTVVTSDAGAGVGYTGIRIRGVDPTRTNVTVNGIPLNDSESHGVFWVNMPDFASSVENIQVQRGVGTSANGAAAFGASVNIKTDEFHEKAYGVLDNSVGSFNTLRNTVKLGTGLINNAFTFDARLSRITSDGYIDRGSSNLKSFYLSGAWLGKKSSLRANVFSGHEKTYQAWYGTPESVINGDRDEIQNYIARNWITGADSANLMDAGRTYNYYTYDNEVDNYQQDHYQLHFSHEVNKYIDLKVSGHYTRGRGYYEQYKAGEELADYGLEPVGLTNDTVYTSDIIRRRWLDNHFFGGLFGLEYKKKGLQINVGGGANQYIGDHFGEIVWAQFASNSQIRDRYYENSSEKFEAQGYAKASYKKNKLTYFLDAQYRYIDYEFLGVDEVSGELKDTQQETTFSFFNPKAGLLYDINSNSNVYLSAAIAHREPVRSDFRESTPANRPVAEKLLNIEAGHRIHTNKMFLNSNIYFMGYKDQLILTGQINDVGGYTRTNVDDSYRAGIELEGGYMITSKLSVSGNVTLSQNKVKNFTEYVDNYDTYVQDTIQHQNTDLSFSPNVIASLGLNYEPVKGLIIGVISKYVGKQYLDNTSTDSRSIDAYFVTNANISYTVKDVFMKEMTFGLRVNNVFNELYVNNGYTWGYVYGGERTVENFYYAQAGTNFLARITLKF